MKVSKKGFYRLSNDLVQRNKPLSTYEFEQDDFEDAVVLTVQEACEILDYLSYLDRLSIKDEFLNGLSHSCKKLLSRIEQVEVEDETK